MNADPEADEDDLVRVRVKALLRKQMLAVRAQLPAAARAARAAAAAERLVALPEFERAATIAAFTAVRAEIDPAPVVAAARAAGKRVALPRVDMEAGAIVLHLATEGVPLPVSGWGIPEPDASAPLAGAGEIDLVLVPALAVDPRGHRIGYGKGLYDRLLPTLPRAVRCAVAYDFQLVAEVPERPGDETVHLVVTDARVIRCPAAS